MLGILVMIGLAFSESAHTSPTPEAQVDCQKALFKAPGLIDHLAADGLIQFRVPNVARFQGRVVSHDENEFYLQGQFGAPRLFQINTVKELELLKDENGQVRSWFQPVVGSEILAALGSKSVVRGSLEDAVLFALEAHGSQIYNNVHYAVHIDAVVAVLMRFKITDPDVRIAAVLHDVIEDTHVTYDEIRIRFGKRVADIVRAVTLPIGVPRAEAFERVYPVIRATPGALWVKLADRIANGEDALANALAGAPWYIDKYAREWDHFKRSLSAGAESNGVEMLDYLETIFTVPAVHI